jgi:hypothetical protein
LKLGTTFRLQWALLAVEVPSDKHSQPAVVTLQPGCVLRLIEERRESALIDVQVGYKRYTVAYSDVLERGDLVLGAADSSGQNTGRKPAANR